MATPARLKVAIDPGHGGKDVGARSASKAYESELVLALAKVLRTTLTKAGFDVILTRENNSTKSFLERARAANEAVADIFVSLHLNACNARNAKGSEVYFLSLDKGDADAAEVAALENAVDDPEALSDSVVSSILENLAQNAFFQDSQRLALAIQDQLNNLSGIKQRGVKQAPLGVLRRTAMPAILVETVFISNPKEDAKIKDPAFQKQVAEAITRGIQNYFDDGAKTPRRKTTGGK